MTLTQKHFQHFKTAANPVVGNAEPLTGERMMTGFSVEVVKILNRCQTQGSAKVEKQTGCPSGTKLSLGRRN